MKMKLKSGQIYATYGLEYKRVVEQQRAANGRYINEWTIRDVNRLEPYRRGSYSDVLNYITDMKFKLLSEPGSNKI